MRFIIGLTKTVLMLIFVIVLFGDPVLAQTARKFGNKPITVRLCPAKCVAVNGHGLKPGAATSVFETRSGWARVSGYLDRSKLVSSFGTAITQKPALWVPVSQLASTAKPEAKPAPKKKKAAAKPVKKRVSVIDRLARLRSVPTPKFRPNSSFVSNAPAAVEQPQVAVAETQPVATPEPALPVAEPEPAPEPDSAPEVAKPVVVESQPIAEAREEGTEVRRALTWEELQAKLSGQKAPPKPVAPAKAAAEDTSEADKAAKAAEAKRLADEANKAKLDAAAKKAAEAKAAEQAAAAKKADEDARKVAEAKAAEDAKKAADAKAKEEARKVAEAKAAEDAKKAADAKAKEEARKVAEAKAAEDAKKAADAKAKEEARKVAEAKAAEDAKKAADAKAKEEARKAAEAKAAEDAKKAAEAKAKEEARKVAEAKAAEDAKKAAAKKAAEAAKLAAQQPKPAGTGTGGYTPPKPDAEEQPKVAVVLPPKKVELPPVKAETPKVEEAKTDEQGPEPVYKSAEADPISFGARPKKLTKALRDKRLKKLPGRKSKVRKDIVIALRHYALGLLNSKECTGIASGGPSTTRGMLYVICTDDPTYLRQFPLEEETW